MSIRLVILWLSLITLVSCAGQSTPATPPESKPEPQTDPYTQGTASRDGIGKFYLGREIAHVMGHRAASWLERPEREEEENVSTALQNMELQPDMRIADIGAGSGYYTFRMAEQVPNGKVFAVDIQPEMLELIRQKAEREGIDNIELIQGRETSPQLPENSVDLVLMVDVYHELSHPREMMEVVVKALRPDGKFILLEYRMEDPEVPIKRLHKMSVEQAEREMATVGLRLQENKSNLPWQHFMVFVKQ
ncbi:class I SAM-dependent methyltransferase [Flavilitoribacter nigricans]|uniref:SAM-dependent methyltransferase n=1 Tax=Flavilitoribacter nigricans (strain ATCC 23147 / DSM 23189 / NBRC 102662 / NCIMB 1420 / SS-2) TaxID=1122177 RepID=A0A2D0N221_FLAN2|nr:class I SAM-dependent methyltransferase [Flavilitoribacter nigricans]PHN02169.1 SAM-dependent methyltransferase [Flavilitoribacter nigricans DSM 23189 = NBRC 102662]